MKISGWILILIFLAFYSCANNSTVQSEFEGPIFKSQQCQGGKTWVYDSAENTFSYAQGMEGLSFLSRSVSGNFQMEATVMLPPNGGGLMARSTIQYAVLIDRDTMRWVVNDSITRVVHLRSLKSPITLRLNRVGRQLSCWWAPQNDLHQLLADVTLPSEETTLDAGLLCLGNGGFVFHNVLFEATPETRLGNANIEMIDLKDRSRKVIFSTSDSIQSVQGIDLERQIVRSNGRLLLSEKQEVDSVILLGTDSILLHSLASNGDQTLVFYEDYISVFNLENHRVRRIPRLRNFIDGMISPDGVSIILSGSRSGEGQDLYRYDLRSGRLDQKTNSTDTIEYQPRIHADSSTIYYTVKTGEHIEIWKLDGEGRKVPVLKGQQAYFSPSLSPDGKWLAFLTANNETSNQVSLQILDLQNMQSSPFSLASFQGSIQSLAAGAWSLDSQHIFFLTH